MISPSFIVGILGNIISVLVYAAPMGVFWDIVKGQSSDKYDVLPYIAILLCKSLWTFYGFFVPNHGLLLITVNGLGVLSEFIYLLIYLLYASKHKRKITLILVAIINVVFVGSVMTLALTVLHGSKRHGFIGILCAAVTLAMYVAPLKVMRVVVKTKSVESMSFSLSFVLLLNAGCWLIFAWLLKDIYVMVPNAFGIVSSLSLIILYIIYKNKSPVAKSLDTVKELSSLHDVEEGIETHKLSSLHDVEKGIETHNFEDIAITKLKSLNLEKARTLSESSITQKDAPKKTMQTE